MVISFTIEEWEKGRLVETVATATNLVVAKAAYRATVVLRPKANLRLRHGARIVNQYEPTGEAC